MGGAVAVTLRTPDGTVHKMCRWTNPLPCFINNLHFFEKDPEHTDEYLSTWYDMRQDWLDNHKTGKFRHTMTDFYADHAALAPRSYGLIVLDQKNNQILDMQDYATPGKFLYCNMFSWLDEVNEEQFNQAVEDQRNQQQHFNFDLDCLQEFWDADRIVGYYKENPNRRGLIIQPYPRNHKSLYDYLTSLWASVGKDFFGIYALHIDMKPFELSKFEKTPTGASQMLEAIRKLGFEVTEEEEQLWQEWINTEE